MIKTIKRATSTISALVLAIAALAPVALIAPMASAASGSDTCVWTGAGDGIKFSDATNWSSCSSAAPVNGDSISFDSSSLTVDTTLTQDINGLVVSTLASTGNNSSSKAYVITGDLGVTNSITSTGTDTAQNYFRFNGTLHIYGNVMTTGSNGYINAPDGGSLIVDLANADLSGSNNLTLNGGLNPTKIIDSATSQGAITVGPNGYLTLSKQYFTSTGAGSSAQWKGNLIIQPKGSVQIFGDSDLASVSSITVQSGASITLCSLNGAKVYSPLTVGGSGPDYGYGPYGAIYTTTTCQMGGGSGPSSLEPEASAEWAGPVTLTSDTKVAGSGEFKITGPLSGNYSISQMSGTVGKVTIASSNNTSKTENGSQSSAVVTTKYADNKPSQTIAVAGNNIAIVDGTYGMVAVSGILKGTGTIASLNVQNGGIVAPGHSPGKLTVLGSMDLQAGSTFEAEIKDSKAGDYDQIAVSKSGSVSLNSAILKVSLYKGYNIKSGDKFTIIDNQSSSKVTGTFKNLAEGATFKVGDAVFKISYKGGTGNDVVLTAQKSISDPNTGFSLAAGNGGLAGLAIVAAGSGILALAIANKRLANKK